MRTDKSFFGVFGTTSCEVVDNEMYFYTRFGDLANINLLDGKIQLTHNKSNGINSRSIFQINGQLYRIDNGAEKIIEINSGREIELIEAQNCGAHIQFAEKHDSYISILYGNGMLFYNIDVKDGNYGYKDLRKKLSDLDVLEKAECNFSYSGLHENRIYVFQKCGGYMFSYDWKKDVLEKYRMPVELGNCQHIAVEGETIFVLNHRNEIYQWKYKRFCIELIWKSSEYDIEQYFNRIHFCGGKFVLLPWSKGKDIVIVNYKEGSAVRYNDYPKGFGYVMSDQYKYVLYSQTEKDIYYPMRTSNYILDISKDTGEINWIKPVIPKEEKMLQMIKNNYSKLAIHDEVLTLDEYISVITCEGFIDNRSSSNIGENMWEIIKK